MSIEMIELLFCDFLIALGITVMVVGYGQVRYEEGMKRGMRKGMRKQRYLDKNLK